jgi:hypothetical protein
VLVLFWCAPLLIPLVLRSDLSTGLKTALSGALAVGIPEVGTLIAVAIMGKPGYRVIKGWLARLFRRVAPPARVSHARYRTGLVLFFVPVLFGWLAPYIRDCLPGYGNHPMVYALAGEASLLLGLFLLGGDFWDKLRALLTHSARVEFEPPRS